MNLYADNDGRFPTGADVKVRFPLSEEQRRGDRGVWPWVNGFVLGQCGADEWDVCVDGAGLTDFDGELLYPCAFRDSSEIRLSSPIPCQEP